MFGFGPRRATSVAAPPRSAVFLLTFLAAACSSADPPAKPATYDVYAVEFASIPVDIRLADWLPGADTTLTTPGSFMVWLLQGPDGRNILVDSGFLWDAPSREGFPLPIADYVRPDLALATVGLAGDDITDVIVSHVHWDHADGLSLFPNAQVWIQRAEFEFYSEAVKIGGEDAAEVEARSMELMEKLNTEGRLTLIDGDDQEILDGIRVYTGAKHTYESQYVGVTTEGGTVIVASDNAWFYANLEHDLANGLSRDPAGQIAAQGRMKELASHPDWVIPGHDRRLFEVFPKPGNGVARIR